MHEIYYVSEGSRTIIVESIFYSCAIIDTVDFHKLTSTNRQNGCISVRREIIYKIISLSEYKEGDEKLFQGPINICAVVTNACNLSCKYCCYSSVNWRSDLVEQIDYKLLSSRINESPFIPVIYISGGEPFTWDSLYDFLCALDFNQGLFVINTNGTLLSNADPKLIELLIERKILINISLDSHDFSVNNGLRSNTNLILNSVRTMVDYGVNVRINTVLTTNNIYSLSSFAEYLISQNIRKWNLINLIGHSQKELYKPTDECLITELEKLFATYSNKIDILYRGELNAPNSLFQINPNGDIVSPSSNADNPIFLGNISKQSFVDAWNGSFDKAMHFKRYFCANYSFFKFYF